ncbi:uncharacterized protein LOC111807661 [Cucurbita pepo subsp. pepo]|uniref:uncharacterized protein LOC111807661 n=1 Tax=Cucurbita pepo subsp. pepo TaxID=3664 RepID=UPI000C9D7E98|nr:uncharacterized protein LOC111807661 [Cucurbita pepo subsp. pepo]
MLTFQVAAMEALTYNLLPLLHLAPFADFRFSRSTVFFTASRENSTSCLYAQLQISESFFTILSTNPNGPEELRSSLQIDEFFFAISLTGTDNILLTALIPDEPFCTNLFFTNSIGHLKYNTILAMGPTPNTNVPEMDDGPFVAIDAEWFRDIATRLCAFNTRIWVTATVSKVTFSAILMEFALPAEDKRCVIGGSNFGDGIKFPVTLIPLNFFIQASYLDNMVYFYMSSGGNTFVKFETGRWTNIVAFNPEDRWEVLPK